MRGDDTLPWMREGCAVERYQRMFKRGDQHPSNVRVTHLVGRGRDLIFQRDEEVHSWVDGVAFDAEPEIRKSPLMLHDLP